MVIRSIQELLACEKAYDITPTTPFLHTSSGKTIEWTLLKSLLVLLIPKLSFRIEMTRNLVMAQIGPISLNFVKEDNGKEGESDGSNEDCKDADCKLQNGWG